MRLSTAYLALCAVRSGEHVPAPRLEALVVRGLLFRTTVRHPRVQHKHKRARRLPRWRTYYQISACGHAMLELVDAGLFHTRMLDRLVGPSAHRWAELGGGR